MNDGKYEFLKVRREFRHPFVTGAGSFSHVERVIIKTEVNGVVGFGEVAPWPSFNTETISECLEVLKSFNGNLSKLTTHLKSVAKSFPCLQAALSSCEHWSEIKSFSKKASCAGLVTNPNPETIKQKLAEGFKTLKIKISPKTEISEIKSLVQSTPTEVVYRLDANGSLNLEQAEAWIHWALSSDRIEFIEQPLAVGHAAYSKLDFKKVAIDESFITPNGINWSGPIVVKPSLVGNWDHFLAWRKTQANKFIYSSAFETAIGRQAALWLAHQDTQINTVGFDTLNQFQVDNLDHHQPGPIVSGLEQFDWVEFWRKLK